jgi:hypothetical protein
MHTSGYQRLSWSGILTVAAGLLAQQGHASNWCPTSTDYQITCSNCSRELTCDVNGISIEILGNNVTLDGQGYSISNAPDRGVLVWSSSGAADATVKNLSIWDPAWNGIEFSGGVSSNWGYVNNVYVSGSPVGGIDHPSWNPIEISDSYSYYNQDGVIGSYASSAAYTDLLRTSVQGNSYDGYYSGGSNSSWVRDNYFWYNGGASVNVSYAQYLWVDGNSLTTSGTGLNIYSSDGTTITDNYGGANTTYDCVHDGSSTSASGNTWGTYSGSGCVF